MNSLWRLVVLFLLALLSACGSGNNAAPVSTRQWTWVSGSNAAGQAGVYGTKGVAASSNIPGARQGAVSWIDSIGNLWLFGGYGFDSSGPEASLNDLWRYDTITLEWTWVSGGNTADQAGVYGTKGIAASSNIPGARQRAVSWIDSSGNVWLFGGYGFDSVGSFDLLNDLWKYDGTNWTWVSGSNTAVQTGIYGTKGVAASSNTPGARDGAISWIDSSGNLWLFGGLGIDSFGLAGALNDLWMFDPATLEWTWVSGGNSRNQAGVYGTRGTASPSNIPGTRLWAVSWIDSSGKFWLFGGQGYDSAHLLARLNDLWKYDPTTLEWTWVSGSSSADQPGIYGTKGTASPVNVPGARESAMSWIDSSGKLWLFGGAGKDSANSYGDLNDLWKYDPTTLEWIWVSGGNSKNQAGVYGTKGIASASSVPGSRHSAVSWIDSSGRFWLFGGESVWSTYSPWFNDLWQLSR